MFTLESKLTEAKSLAATLLDGFSGDIELIKLPDSGGVYLFKNSTGQTVYVGKARNLHRRIRTDHLSRESQDTMSAFRRSINRVFGVPFGPEMRVWICRNCKISFIEIDDPDMRSLVEALIIASVRSNSLLNHDR